MKITKPTPAGAGLATAALVLSLALVPVALAGKSKPPSGGSGSSTLTGPVMVNDADGNGVVSHGDSINFSVATTATGTPTVGLRCYQNGSFVLDGYVGYYSSWAFTPYFVLDSSYWQSGVAANCTARLFYDNRRGQEVVLSTLSFTVAA